MIKKILLLSFVFLGIINAANINVNKNIYNTNEAILVTFSDMEAQHEDWIAIYPAESNTDWNNVLKWEWTEDVEEGTLTFDGLPEGDYEVRAFYNNSYRMEASKAFTVEVAHEEPTVTTDKATYLDDEQITVNFANMTAKNQDWIGIYPKNKSNDWGNQVAWHWTNDTENGQINFNSLPAGEYEVRAFYNNSFNLEAKKEFTVTHTTVDPTLSTNKASYLTNEQITVNFANMAAKNQDWIGIYPKESSSAWKNVVAWHWTDDTTNGQVTFDALPVGEYEARAFYNNSGHLEATKAFTVTPIPQEGFIVKSEKDIYKSNELIRIYFNHMRGTSSDWIGIFPIGADNQKESAIEWRKAKSLVKGELTFNGLPTGTYEVRAYFATLHKETIQFTVEEQEDISTLFEDAEEGIDPRWNHYSGQFPLRRLNVGAQGSEHSIRASIDMTAARHNLSGYYFPFGDTDKELKFLNLDVRIGMSSHVGDFTVFVKTKNGNRRIVWAVYLNHPGNDFSGNAKFRAPFHASNGYVLMNPAPSDYYLIARNEHSSRFTNYKINVEKTLRILEPDNELLSITGFTTAGGDFDNITLSSL